MEADAGTLPDWLGDGLDQAFETLSAHSTNGALDPMMNLVTRVLFIQKEMCWPAVRSREEEWRFVMSYVENAREAGVPDPLALLSTLGLPSLARFE